MSQLVTGEGVALDLPYARLASRGVAFGIDVAMQATALVVLLALITTRSNLDFALLAALLLVAAVLVLVGYPVTFETLSRGRTLGKMAMGLRVVRDDGGAIRFRHALVRGLAGFFVDFWALGLGGCVALVVSLVSERGKRVGDVLAGTVVIRDRAPGRSSTGFGAVPMPPHLARWAATLDLSRLPDGLALAVRQYLSRAGLLTDYARAELGDKLSGEVLEHIGSEPPPDTTRLDFLAAVIAERRNREHAKATSGTTTPRPEGPPPPSEPARPAQPAQPRPPDGPFAPPG